VPHCAHQLGWVNSASTSDTVAAAAFAAAAAAARHKRAAIVVCHSVPTNWAFPEPMYTTGAPCPPDPREFGWVYQVGRTMFETDRLPSLFVPRWGPRVLRLLYCCSIVPLVVLPRWSYTSVQLIRERVLRMCCQMMVVSSHT
jgi:hypothetical protein